MNSSRVAGLIGAAFGFVFVVVNAGAAGSPWSWLLRGLGLALAVVAIRRSTRAPDRRLDPRRSAIRVYWASVAAEIVALVVGTRLLAANDVPEYGVALVAAVVGIHFLPFSWAFREPRFRLLGGALVAVAALGVLVGVTVGDDALTLVAGVGAGLVLLVFAATTPQAPGSGRP